MNHIKKTISLLTGPERKRGLLLIGLTFLGAILETLGIGLIVPILGLISKEDIGSSYPQLKPLLNYLGNPSQQELVIGGMLLLVFVYLLKNLFLGFLSWIQSKFTFDLQLNLSQRLFSTYLKQPYTFHLQRNSSQLVLNVINEVNLFTFNVISPVIMLLAEGSVLLCSGILLIVVEPVGAIFVLLILACAAYSFHRLTKKHITKWGEIRQYHDGLRIQHLQQGLNGIKDVKISGREDEFLSQYYLHNAKSSKVGQLITTMKDLPRLWIEFLAILGLALLVIIMILQGRQLTALIPTLGLFAAAAFRLMPSVNRILGGIQSLRYATPIINTLHGELNIPMEVQHKEGVRAPSFGKSIEIKDLTYSYPVVQTKALVGITLSIKKGECIGFIGPSGSGKSTLVDVILGLFQPSFGSICVDGNDIQQSLRSWQNQIGYVSQSIYLTDDTLKRNIAFGLRNDEIDDAAVMRAIKSAQLDVFLKDLPEGLETIVGERGVRLSGGQRQRIGIARALYHDPEVLMLDEATSALDVETERGVMEAVRELQGTKTILIIAHRLSTVENCNRIYKMQSGKIVGEGIPEQILKK